MLAASFGSLFVANLVKNFFEESVWRGFLTEELLRRPISDYALYLVVGLVWGLWHLPYYLYFLDPADQQEVLGVSPLAFAMIATGTMICWSVAFTEIYRLTRSIWPLVLMHTVEDATINPLVIDGLVDMSDGAAVFFSPIVGTLPAAAFVVVGLGLRRLRRRHEPHAITTAGAPKPGHDAGRPTSVEA